MKTDLERLLFDLVGIANRTKAGQITHKIEEIKEVFLKQEEQHQKTIKYITNLTKLELITIKQRHKIQLERMITRLKMLKGRFQGCEYDYLNRYAPSIVEIDSWIKELNQLLETHK